MKNKFEIIDLIFIIGCLAIMGIAVHIITGTPYKYPKDIYWGPLIGVVFIAFAIIVKKGKGISKKR